MRTSAIVFLAYGILVILGGLMGYQKARSMPSLLSGGIAGVLLVIGALVMLQGRPQVVFFEMAVAILLILFFLYRLLSTGKLMPALPAIVLSAIAIVVALLEIRRP
ncbi:MAG: TMEM14 family protein [Candidatus Eisenbacteria bacterium]